MNRRDLFNGAVLSILGGSTLYAKGRASLTKVLVLENTTDPEASIQIFLSDGTDAYIHAEASAAQKEESMNIHGNDWTIDGPFPWWVSPWDWVDNPYNSRSEALSALLQAIADRGLTITSVDFTS